MRPLILLCVALFLTAGCSRTGDSDRIPPGPERPADTPPTMPPAPDTVPPPPESGTGAEMPPPPESGSQDIPSDTTEPRTP